MKWIKREEAIESIAKRMLTREEWYKSSDAKESARYMLKDTNPIEIIQCKDCKHYLNEHICMYFSRHGTIETSSDAYCSYGERREP